MGDRMEFKYAKYSEECYYSRVQLKNMYSSTIADLMYDEILKYRLLYRHEIIFTNRKYYITLNLFVFNKILKIYELDTNLNKFPMTLSYEHDSYLNVYEKQMNVEINDVLKSFLQSDENFIIKIFVLYCYVKEKSLWRFFLRANQKEHWIAYLEKVKIDVFEYGEPLDLTYMFRIFLDEFMNVMRTGKSKVSKVYHKDELKQKFPKLNDTHLFFILKHCDKNAYYTISQFQKFTDFSYEGSRLAMQMLCEEGFYQKIKIGKKYCYIFALTIVE